MKVMNQNQRAAWQPQNSTEQALADAMQRIADLEAHVARLQQINADNERIALTAIGRLAQIAEIEASVPGEADFGWHWRRVHDLASEGVIE